MTSLRDLILPKKDGTHECIKTQQNVLFVGANGAGKSRLGAWIEISSPQMSVVHRISAQKSLAMPDSTTPVSIDVAEKNLIFGHSEQQNKSHYRWHNKPATTLLSDFEKVMVFLFSDETEENAKFKVAAKATQSRVEPPTTRLDLVKKVWETILPHRELIIGGLRIQTKVVGAGGQTYNSSEMSDGERVIFYLVSQCLAAPKDGIIVIDEPELHLHKSIQHSLWSEVEKLRPDCLFVYFTHDVEFASTMESAKKIWLKSFDGTYWEWEMIGSDSELPESLILEVLGSRKPVVFVEGDSGSYDASFYREVLPKFLVVPRGSCSQVIQSVRAFKANPQFHHLSVFGIVDRDRRVPAEINKLEREGIHVLLVAEVENLFCTQEILEVVSSRLSRNPTTDFQDVSSFVFSKLQSEIDAQVSLRVSSEIKRVLGSFQDGSRGLVAVKSSYSNLVAQIDVDALYSQFTSEIGTIIATNDYKALLGAYNRKSLSAQVSCALGLQSGELPELVLRLVKGAEKANIIQRIKPYFGSFSINMS